MNSYGGRLAPRYPIYVYVYVWNAFSVTELGITGFDTLISQNNTVAWFHSSMEYTRSNMSACLIQFLNLAMLFWLKLYLQY